MNETLKTLFLDNLDLSDQLTAYCKQDPALLQAERELYETGVQIARLVGFELYDEFESRFHTCLGRYANLYYLFGLGLRQELLFALFQA